MKKLFILLSILALTNPSYACGCTSSLGGEIITLLIVIAFLTIIVGIPPVIPCLFAKKGHRLFLYTRCLIVWGISVPINLGLTTLFYENFTSLRDYMLEFIIFIILLPVILMCLYCYSYTKNKEAVNG